MSAKIRHPRSLHRDDPTLHLVTYLNEELLEELEASRHGEFILEVYKDLFHRQSWYGEEERLELSTDLRNNLVDYLQYGQDDAYEEAESTKGHYIVCDVCLSPITNNYYHCDTCINYDECIDCNTRKMQEDRSHPHGNFTEVSGKLFGPSYEQDNLLCFDGGGIRGYCSVLMFQRYCERVLSESSSEVREQYEDNLDLFVRDLIRKKFDLLCGTSIGGIIAILLAAELPLSTVRGLFEDPNRRAQIFQKEWFYKLNASKYTNTGLQDLFRDLMVDANLTEEDLDPDDMRMYHLKIPVAVTTLDFPSNEVLWITNQDTQISSRFDTRNFRIMDAVLSTSAAPTYFPIRDFRVTALGAEIDDPGEPSVGVSCVDGGLWGNDPALFGYNIRRALVFADRQNAIYNIISFGTGEFRGTGYYDTNHSWNNSVSWLVSSPNIIDVMMNASSSLTEQLLNFRAKTGVVKHIKVQLELPAAMGLDDITSIPEQARLVEEKDPNDWNRAVFRTFYCGINDHVDVEE